MYQNSKRGQSGANRQNNMQRNVDGDIIVKRLTLPEGAVSSTAGGIIAVDAVATTGQCQSLPASEWASFAARYQQFRVRAVTVILEPIFPGSGTPTAAATVGHSTLYVGDYIGTAVPGSAAQVLSDERGICINTSKRMVYTVDWARNPNAKLWNPTSAALPAANSMGIAIASNTTVALPAATAIYTTTVMWDVEFRGSQ